MRLQISDGNARFQFAQGRVISSGGMGRHLTATQQQYRSRTGDHTANRHE
jgi:hypothetical protein